MTAKRNALTDEQLQKWVKKMDARPGTWVQLQSIVETRQNYYMLSNRRTRLKTLTGECYEYKVRTFAPESKVKLSGRRISVEEPEPTVSMAASEMAIAALGTEVLADDGVVYQLQVGWMDALGNFYYMEDRQPNALPVYVQTYGESGSN